MNCTGYYADAPVYDHAIETLLDLSWRMLRGRVALEEVRRYVLSSLENSMLDLCYPLDALVRLGCSEAEARRILKDEDLEELL